MSDLWITVPDWDKFQHYSDRDPLWIKVYTRLLHDDSWLSLTDAEKGLLCTVWLEFASTGGQIRVGRVPSSVRPVRVQRTLERLNNAGFIELSASKPLALTRSREKSTSYLREEKTRKRANKEPARVFEEEEPPRDPEALTKILGLADRIGKPL